MCLSYSFDSDCKMANRMNILDYSVNIVCIIGFIYQCYYVSNQYFGFQVISEIYLSKPEQFTPLSVSILIYLPQITNFTDLILKNKLTLNHYPAINWREINPNQINPSVEQYLFKIIDSNKWFESLYEPTRFVKASYVRDPNLYNSRLNSSKYLDLKLMLSYRGYLCYTFEYIHDIDYNYDDLFFERTLPWMQIFTLDTRRTKTNIFYLHQRKTYPRGERRNVIWNLANEIYHISYKRKIIQNLPPPYTTNCKDYTLENYEDRSHKVEECFLRQCKKLFGAVCASVIYPKESNLKLDFINNDTRRTTFSIISEQISKHCLKLTDQVDCYSEIIVSEVLLKEPSENSTHIVILPPIDLDIIFKKSPKIIFIDLFIYIGSSMSLWFNFGFLNLLLSFNKFGKKFKDKYLKWINKSVQINLTISNRTITNKHQIKAILKPR